MAVPRIFNPGGCRRVSAFVTLWVLLLFVSVFPSESGALGLRVGPAGLKTPPRMPSSGAFSKKMKSSSIRPVSSKALQQLVEEKAPELSVKSGAATVIPPVPAGSGAGAASGTSGDDWWDSRYANAPEAELASADDLDIVPRSQISPKKNSSNSGSTMTSTVATTARAAQSPPAIPAASVPSPAPAAAPVVTYSVKLPDSAEIVSVSVAPNSVAADILDEVERQTGLAAGEHQLAHAGKPLLRDEPVEGQGVPRQAVLDLLAAPVVRVQLPSGEFEPVTSVTRAQPIEWIARLVGARLDVPTRCVELAYNGKTLDNDATLAEHRVPFGATVLAKLRPTVTVRLPSRQEVHFYDPRDTPLAQIAERIAKATGVAPDAQELRLAAKPLDPALSLEKNGVPAGGVVDLVRKPGLVVSLPDQRRVELFTLSPADTPLAVKSELARRAGAAVPAERLDCFARPPDAAAEPLKDHSALADQGVQFGATLWCRQKPSFRVQFARDRAEKPLQIFIDYESATLLALKTAVHQQTQLPEALQVAFYAGAELKDPDALLSATVPFGGTVTLDRLPFVHFALPDGRTTSYADISKASALTTVARRMLDEYPELFPSSLVDQIERDNADSGLTDEENGEKRDALARAAAAEVGFAHQGAVLDPSVPLQNFHIAPGARIDVFRRRALDVRADAVLPHAPLRIQLPDKSVISLADEATVVSKTPNDLLDEIERQRPDLDRHGLRLAYETRLLDDLDVPLAERGVPEGGVIDAFTTAQVPLASAILEDCNVEIYGEDCFLEPTARERYRAFSRRVAWVMLVYASLLFALFAVVHRVVRFLSRNIARSRDRFKKEFLESIFRAISVVAIVTALIEILLNFDVFELRLEHRLFRKFAEEEDSFYGGRALQVLFTRMVEKVQFCLAIYLYLVAAYAVIAFIYARWMEQVEMKTLEEQQQALVPSTVRRKQRAEMEYIVARYEFREKTRNMSLPGMDPDFEYFFEYLRSCLFSLLTRLVRLPTSLMALGAGLVFALGPVSLWKPLHQVALTLGLQLVPLLVIAFLGWRTGRIANMLLPFDIPAYVQTMERIRVTGWRAPPGHLLNVGPVYKYGGSGRKSAKTPVAAFFARLVLRTRYPNRHEALFWFWRAGRVILFRLLEFSVFLMICVAGQALHSVNRQWPHWRTTYGRWPYHLFWLQLLVYPLALHWVLWRMLISLYTGGLVQDRILTDVWAVNRAEMIRRIARFIDLWRIEATLWDLQRAGPDYLLDLRTRVLESLTPEVEAQNRQLWHSVDADEELNLPQLYQLLVDQGLNYQEEAECRTWMTVFDADHNGGISRSEFAVLVNVAGQLTQEPFDVSVAQSFLADELRKHPPKEGPEPAEMTFGAFRTLLRRLHLHKEWSRTHAAHFFELVTGNKDTRSMPINVFIAGIKRIEQETLGALVDAVGELNARQTAVATGPGDIAASVDGSEEAGASQAGASPGGASPGGASPDRRHNTP